jgi:predicted unusual protein kinase regulating ubiquinone biosynthesis (AarF/ABC1/UbiB family)
MVSRSIHPPKKYCKNTYSTSSGFIFRAILRFVELVVVASPAIITAPFALLFPSLFANVWWKLLRVTLESAGATWIKLGQWAGTRPDL